MLPGVAGQPPRRGCALSPRSSSFPGSLRNGLEVKVCIYATPFASSIAINRALREAALEYFNISSILWARRRSIGGTRA